MISGNDYKGLYECGYLDANLQNAEDMNLNCIKDKSKGEDKLCTSDYRKLHDNIAFNSQFISIKRGFAPKKSVMAAVETNVIVGIAIISPFFQSNNFARINIAEVPFETEEQYLKPK